MAATQSTTVTVPAASLRNHPNFYWARLSEMAESVTFKDDSTTEITEIKINLLPDKDAVIKLSGRLHKLFTQEQRKEALQRTTPLLRIETIDLSDLTPTTSDYQTTMLMHDSLRMEYHHLFNVLEIATVKELKVLVQSEVALERLIQVLSTSGCLARVEISNIAQQALFNRLGEVFKRHSQLEELTLNGIRPFPDSARLVMPKYEIVKHKLNLTIDKIVLKKAHVEWLYLLTSLRRFQTEGIIIQPDARSELQKVESVHQTLREIRTQ